MILDYTIEELEEYIKGLGEPKFRAGQVFTWLSRGAEIDEMKNLPAALREKLKEDLLREGVTSPYPRLLRLQESKTDGTRKLLFGMKDGTAAEAVFMKYSYGNSACISTQIGCRMGCKFCASGMDGLVRNLTAGEMLGEILAMENAVRDSFLKATGNDAIDPAEYRITHIVLMGTGEPMDNYENVAKFLRLIHDPKGKNLSYRNITISTCGVIPGIERLGKEFPQVNLAISLHQTTDEKRSALMPVNKRYPLADLLKACRKHAEITGRRITFEYTLIRGENDSPKDAEKLFNLLRGTLCHVNLIPLNKVEEKEYTGATREAAQAFAAALEKKGIPATVRRELGSDIDAACGQLRRHSAEGK